MKNQKPVKTVKLKEQSLTASNLFAKMLFGFLRRIFIRLFFLPFYAMLAAPWLLILFTTTDPNTGIQQKAYELTCFLAGKPAGASLDEGDIGGAVLLLFVIADVVFEFIAYLRGKSAEDARKSSDRTRFIVQCILSLTGWIIFGMVMYQEQGVEAAGIAITIGVVSCAFFWMEYQIRLMMDRFKF